MRFNLKMLFGIVTLTCIGTLLAREYLGPFQVEGIVRLREVTPVPSCYPAQHSPKEFIDMLYSKAVFDAAANKMGNAVTRNELRYFVDSRLIHDIRDRPKQTDSTLTFRDSLVVLTVSGNRFSGDRQERIASCLDALVDSVLYEMAQQEKVKKSMRINKLQRMARACSDNKERFNVVRCELAQLQIDYIGPNPASVVQRATIR